MTWTPCASAATDGMTWSVAWVGFTWVWCQVAPPFDEYARNTWLTFWTSESYATFTLPDGDTARLGNSWTLAARLGPNSSTPEQTRLEVPIGLAVAAILGVWKLPPASSDRATQIWRPGKSNLRSWNGLENRSH